MKEQLSKRDKLLDCLNQRRLRKFGYTRPDSQFSDFTKTISNESKIFSSMVQWFLLYFDVKFYKKSTLSMKSYFLIIFSELLSSNCRLKNQKNHFLTFLKYYMLNTVHYPMSRTCSFHKF